MCSVCGKPAQSTCAICGRLVCPDHFYQKAGMCSHCIPVPERRNGEHRKGMPPALH